MIFLILNTDKHNGTILGVNEFYAAPILKGQHEGKWAISPNALNEFPEIFENLTYEIVDLDASAFQIDYTIYEQIGEYRHLYTKDLKISEQIEIALYKDKEFSIIRDYVNGTWTDEDVENYILALHSN